MPQMQWHERIGQRLRLRDLHILLAVTDAGTMARAATQLGVSQPAVSKAIAELERTIGFRLLDRTKNGLVPTDYGRTLVRHAAVIFDELKQGVDELQFISDPTSGELRIGASESMTAGLLPAIIANFSNQYPKIILHVAQIGFAPLDLRDLRERTAELVLGRVPSPLQEPDLDAEILLNERIYIVAGTNSRWSRRRHINLAELMEEPWALPPVNSLPGMLVMEAFRSRGLGPPPATVFTASIHLLADTLPLTGRFLTVVPETVLRFNAGRLPLKILPVDFQVEPAPIGLIWLKHRMLSPVAQLFRECARKLPQSDAGRLAPGYRNNHAITI